MENTRIKLVDFLEKWSGEVTILNEEGATITAFNPIDVSAYKIISDNPNLNNALVKKVDIDDSMFAGRSGGLIITVDSNRRPISNYEVGMYYDGRYITENICAENEENVKIFIESRINTAKEYEIFYIKPVKKEEK